MAVVVAKRHRAEVAGALRAAMADAHVMHIRLALLLLAEQVAADAFHAGDPAHVLALALVRSMAHAVTC